MNILTPDTKIVFNHWLLVSFFIIAIGICYLILVCGKYLGGKSNARHKNIPFESGIDSLYSARLRLSVKFYLIAMFFVTFDIETIYLFAWSVSIRENGWFGFIEAVIFISVLIISLLYLVRIGALKWTPINSLHK